MKKVWIEQCCNSSTIIQKQPRRYGDHKHLGWLSSEAINAQHKAAPGIHVQNAILDIDVAKIRKDAEEAIRADVEYLQKQANVKSGAQYSIASLCHCSHCIATYAKSKAEQEVNKKGSAEAEPLEHLKARGAVLFQAVHHPKDYLKRAASTWAVGHLPLKKMLQSYNIL